MLGRHLAYVLSLLIEGDPLAESLRFLKGNLGDEKRLFGVLAKLAKYPRSLSDRLDLALECLEKLVERRLREVLKLKGMHVPWTMAGYLGAVGTPEQIKEFLLIATKKERRDLFCGLRFRSGMVPSFRAVRFV